VFAEFNEMPGSAGRQFPGEPGRVIGDNQIVIDGCASAKQIPHRTADEIDSFLPGKNICINRKQHRFKQLYRVKLNKKTGENT